MSEVMNKFLKKDNLLIIVLSGILLFIIVLPTKSKSDNDTVIKSTYDADKMQLESTYDSEEAETDYLTDMEERFTRLLLKVNGVGEVEVMLTLNSDEEKPGIEGAVIVASGAGTGKVDEDIIAMAHALFGLNEDKIKVVKMTSHK